MCGKLKSQALTVYEFEDKWWEYKEEHNEHVLTAICSIAQCNFSGFLYLIMAAT